MDPARNEERFIDWKWTQSGLHLFFMQGQSLYRADYETRSIDQVTPDRVQGYALLENYIYFVTASPPVLFRQDLVDRRADPAGGASDRTGRKK
ncbi:MAG: hypothetical protein MPW15_00175 [Candidatus Manganitrophus sp.]|nr:hypothetical protein [Candidatus Manganitrophus sp.]